MKSYFSLSSALAVGILVAPVLAMAATFIDTLALINGIINSFIPILISLAIVVFFWGMVQYLFKLGGEDGAKAGLNLMIWGILGIFVMVSVWGIVQLLQSTFKVTSGDPILPKPIQFNP